MVGMSTSPRLLYAPLVTHRAGPSLSKVWALVPSGMASARLFVFTFPLVFVVASWLAGAGLPYYIDNNETYLTYVHARNLEIWDPSEYGWLTAAATDPTLPQTEKVYAHNPNGPRYLHYLLLRAGIRDLPNQTLLLSLIATGLSVLLLWHLFNHHVLLVVPLAVVLDYSGFLAWTVNTYRVWTFVLYFGAILAVVRGRPGWLGLVTFAAFQVEYGLALFLGTTTTILAILIHGRRAWSLIATSALGAIVSLSLFAGQILWYAGWDGLVTDLTATFARRTTHGASTGIDQHLLKSVLGLIVLCVSVSRDAYNHVVGSILVVGLMAAPVLLLRGRRSEPHRFLVMLMISTTLGAVVTSTLLFNYFVEGFVFSQLPLATFLIAPAMGIVSLELQRLLAGRWPRPGLAALCGAMALLPLLAASVTMYRPPVAPDLIRLLATSYQGRSIVGPGISPELAFALTGGRAASIGGIGSSLSVPAVPADREQLASMRDADGTLTLACLDPVTPAHTKNPLFADCKDILADMAPRIRSTDAVGAGWTVARFEP